MQITVFDDAKTVLPLRNLPWFSFDFYSPETKFKSLPEIFQVFCFKKNNGSFKWIDENGENAVLGPCVAGEATTVAPTEAPTCKPIELKGSQTKSGMEVNCKVNSSEFFRFLKHFTLTRF